MTTLRIGLGKDLHRLEEGHPCILGGVEIPSPVGARGHSDGDALLHALTDALLGAAGLADLGAHFPDTDPQWKDAPSRIFVERAMTLLAARGLRPVSTDCVLECDRPSIAPHRAAMRQNVARLLGLPLDRVNVKGKSREGAGGVETVTATVVVLLDEVRREP